jgi:hypothetical protein
MGKVSILKVVAFCENRIPAAMLSIEDEHDHVHEVVMSSGDAAIGCFGAAILGIERVYLVGREWLSRSQVLDLHLA